MSGIWSGKGYIDYQIFFLFFIFGVASWVAKRIKRVFKGAK